MGKGFFGIADRVLSFVPVGWCVPFAYDGGGSGNARIFV